MKTLKYLLVFLLLLFATSAIAQVEKASVFLTVTPTLSTAGAYATGNLIGTAPIVLPNAVCGHYSTGYLTGAVATDADNQLIPTDLLIFSANPNTTTYTNRAVYAPTAADLLSLVTAAKLTVSYAFSANGALVLDSVAKPVIAQAAQTLYLVPVARGSGTYTHTNAVQYTLAFACDLQKL
jgi:hypothetical protein